MGQKSNKLLPAPLLLADLLLLLDQPVPKGRQLGTDGVQRPGPLLLPGGVLQTLPEEPAHLPQPQAGKGQHGH